MENIWSNVKDLLYRFFQFTLAHGENDFMLVNDEFMNGDGAGPEAIIFYLASFVIMVLFAFLSCDSFLLNDLGREFKEAKNKVSFFKVLVFTAGVFSIHTFYKMLVAVFGQMIHADASIMALDCLGSYINPISLMIYAYTISTMEFQNRGRQALFLGWAIFLTPAAMSFYGFTPEHCTIYIVAALFGVVGAILYKKISPYVTCFIFYIIYFIAKYFMIYFSDQVILLSEDTIIGKIGQYMACMQMDIIIALILLLVLFEYRIATTTNVKWKREWIFSGVVALIMCVAIVSSNIVTVVAMPIYEPVVEEPEIIPEEIASEEESEQEMPETTFVIIVSSANIRSGPGTDYDVVTTATEGEVFYGTGNELLKESGRTWYEIYIDEELTQTGWASDKVIQMQE